MLSYSRYSKARETAEMILLQTIPMAIPSFMYSHIFGCDTATHPPPEIFLVLLQTSRLCYMPIAPSCATLGLAFYELRPLLVCMVSFPQTIQASKSWNACSFSLENTFSNHFWVSCFKSPSSIHKVSFLVHQGNVYNLQSRLHCLPTCNCMMPQQF